ncbi:uncharacterized protein Bfra_010648 [Botrytis fragariae]|uniref:Uncharacterized protein n=1 Tax=Botrytis fragariae TaxID=1964551 RepID=A0A8H6AI02_9HELO|nr:uncharacterized protein Bfra_010648 [Botrytis fragariae]KAF5867679.1 hypothetical protein Bfra_010648 [Botrytis fragariae]
MPYIPSPRILKPKASLTYRGVSGPGIRYRNDHIVIDQAGSRAYHNKRNIASEENGGKVCGHNGIVSTWSSPPYH